MCGIVGIAGVMPVNQSIYDALTVLQHRGQDAAGIITIDANNCFRLRKANGLVNDIFEARHMQRLQGNMGIGHVRYPTAGSSSASEAQPFYVNSPYGITLAHNGNLTNAHELRKKLFEEKRRHINTTSDSEILLNISPASSTTSVTIRWKPTIFLPRLPRLTVKSAAPMPAWR
ncbi:amidophosphoribosyltransferase [Salmonella enterica subsp. enterica]|uniref:Amidophosphoribosyltransferase n=1 Tax=Salmonella enterica I TaxID=59201 RepID=A0A379WPI9_SALET|nr:amidophosphoribosyltransferase [Salmonella enterica subsp. enterica]